MQSIINEQKIHFYEYMEVELIHEYIESGILYFLNTIIDSQNSLVHLRYYTPQLASLLNLAKDVYFLVTKNALYAESFYGLERKKQLTKLQLVKNVIVWFVIPYICKRVERWYKVAKQRERPSPVEKILIAIFPYLYALIGGIQTFLKFNYLITKDSKFYNLQYWATKTSTTYRQQEQQTYRYPLFQLMKSPGLLVLLLGHKVLSLFYSKKKTNKKHKLGDIPAPLHRKKEKKCPICGLAPKTPAFLKVSGFVFCYDCIHHFVNSQGMCPITKIPIGIDNIQIIYN